jgi:hypothetical protein
MADGLSTGGLTGQTTRFAHSLAHAERPAMRTKKHRQPMTAAGVFET